MVDNEMLQAMRQLIQEELEPLRQSIHQELEPIKKDIASLQAAVLGIDNDVGRIEEKMDDMVSAVQTNSFDIAKLRNKVS